MCMSKKAKNFPKKTKKRSEEHKLRRDETKTREKIQEKWEKIRGKFKCNKSRKLTLGTLVKGHHRATKKKPNKTTSRQSAVGALARRHNRAAYARIVAHSMPQLENKDRLRIDTGARASNARAVAHFVPQLENRGKLRIGMECPMPPLATRPPHIFHFLLHFSSSSSTLSLSTWILSLNPHPSYSPVSTQILPKSLHFFTNFSTFTRLFPFSTKISLNFILFLPFHPVIQNVADPRRNGRSGKVFQLAEPHFWRDMERDFRI